MSGDPLRLLRQPGPVAPYPPELSDEELARRAGLAPGAIVRYDMNTLGGGPLPAVRAAWAAWDPARAVEYGDLGYRRLREALAEVIGIPAARIVPGAGADELIRLVTTSVVGPGDAVVIPSPTFAMFGVEAGLAGARVVEVPRRRLADRQTVRELRVAVKRSAARLAWVCSPNNPTGDAYPLDELRELAAGLEAIVVVDEVYLEFAEAATGAEPESTSATRLQAELSNLLVLRSLAKAYGLAGARIGYLVVPDALAERFDALRLPLSVGSATEALALGALSDVAGARQRQRQIASQRARLAEALRQLGCEVLDGVANFVTFRPPAGVALEEALLRRGLVVRGYAFGPLAGWVRATARAPDENDRLLDALRELLA